MLYRDPHGRSLGGAIEQHFVQDTLMGNVLVDEEQRAIGLRDDVHVAGLRQDTHLRATAIIRADSGTGDGSRSPAATPIISTSRRNREPGRNDDQRRRLAADERVGEPRR